MNEQLKTYKSGILILTRNDSLGYRTAANHIWDNRHHAGSVDFVHGVDIRYTCNTVQRLIGDDGAYNNVFESEPGERYIDVHDVEGVSAGYSSPTIQMQLHRALMLDFMAELIEQGDLDAILRSE